MAALLIVVFGQPRVETVGTQTVCGGGVVVGLCVDGHSKRCIVVTRANVVVTWAERYMLDVV